MVFVRLTDSARRDLNGLDTEVARRIIDKLSWLETHFQHIIPEKLHHNLREYRKLRVGAWRAIYYVSDGMIIVEAVKHRSEAYD